MSTDGQTVERLARIETHIESMAKTLETIAKDHETRIRALEVLAPANASALAELKVMREAQAAAERRLAWYAGAGAAIAFVFSLIAKRLGF